MWRNGSRRARVWVVGGVAGALLAGGVSLAGVSLAAADDGSRSGPGSGPGGRADDRVTVRVLAPRPGDRAGIAGRGWIVDLRLRYPGGADGLARAGFTGFQLTGPAGHNNVPPFPGTFAPGRDDRLPGLVVLASTTRAFSGPGTNLANLFNLTGVTDRTAQRAEIWDTWMVGAPIAGTGVDTVLTAAVVADRNGNGVFDDAPDVVPDLTGDGVVDRRDLVALGVASNVVTVRFHLAGD